MVVRGALILTITVLLVVLVVVAPVMVITVLPEHLGKELQVDMEILLLAVVEAVQAAPEAVIMAV